MIKIMLKTVNDQNTLLEEDDIKNHTVIHGPSSHEGSQLVYKKKIDCHQRLSFVFKDLYN